MTERERQRRESGEGAGRGGRTGGEGGSRGGGSESVSEREDWGRSLCGRALHDEGII